MQNQIIGSRISNLRKQANEKQEDLAKVIKCNRASLANYENGKRMIDINRLIMIAEHYNTTTDYLLGLSDVSTTDVDIKQVCDYTGLSEIAVQELNDENVKIQDDEDISIYSEIMSRFIEECSSDFVRYIDEYDVCNWVSDLLQNDMNSSEYVDKKSLALFKLINLVTDFAKEYSNRDIKNRCTVTKLNNNDSSDNSNSDSGSDCSDSS
ncbi:MAG: helix-turn-helix domain-containing protein, partial [Acutalibacteraceae bacterium]